MTNEDEGESAEVRDNEETEEEGETQRWRVAFSTGLLLEATVDYCESEGDYVARLREADGTEVTCSAVTAVEAVLGCLDECAIDRDIYVVGVFCLAELPEDATDPDAEVGR